MPPDDMIQALDPAAIEQLRQRAAAQEAFDAAARRIAAPHRRNPDAVGIDNPLNIIGNRLPKAAASMADILGGPSKGLDWAFPGAGQAWRDYYQSDPPAAALGGVVGGPAMLGAFRGMTAAPKLTAGAVGAGAALAPTSAGEAEAAGAKGTRERPLTIQQQLRLEKGRSQIAAEAETRSKAEVEAADVAWKQANKPKDDAAWKELSMTPEMWDASKKGFLESELGGVIKRRQEKERSNAPMIERNPEAYSALGIGGVTAAAALPFLYRLGSQGVKPALSNYLWNKRLDKAEGAIASGGRDSELAQTMLGGARKELAAVPPPAPKLSDDASTMQRLLAGAGKAGVGRTAADAATGAFVNADATVAPHFWDAKMMPPESRAAIEAKKLMADPKFWSVQVPYAGAQGAIAATLGGKAGELPRHFIPEGTAAARAYGLTHPMPVKGAKAPKPEAPPQYAPPPREMPLYTPPPVRPVAEPVPELAPPSSIPTISPPPQLTPTLPNVAISPQDAAMALAVPKAAKGVAAPKGPAVDISEDRIAKIMARNPGASIEDIILGRVK